MINRVIDGRQHRCPAEPHTIARTCRDRPVTGLARLIQPVGAFKHAGQARPCRCRLSPARDRGAPGFFGQAGLFLFLGRACDAHRLNAVEPRHDERCTGRCRGAGQGSGQFHQGKIGRHQGLLRRQVAGPGEQVARLALAPGVFHHQREQMQGRHVIGFGFQDRAADRRSLRGASRAGVFARQGLRLGQVHGARRNGHGIRAGCRSPGRAACGHRRRS